jgi:hypothetical protein
MPWVRFVDKFDWRPHRSVVIAFKKDMRLFVTRACADEALAKGKAVPDKRPLEKPDAGR